MSSTVISERFEQASFKNVQKQRVPWILFHLNIGYCYMVPFLTAIREKKVYSPTCIKQASIKGIIKVCLLNKGMFQCYCLFQKMNTCLCNSGCLLNTGGH